jgi:DMSO/TMAO reductase YedYZ heme-binding membrane subunit
MLLSVYPPSINSAYTTSNTNIIIIIIIIIIINSQRFSQFSKGTDSWPHLQNYVYYATTMTIDVENMYK